MVKVVVGSKNPVKVEGVRQAFLQYFDEVEVSSREVDSGVGSQPFNDDSIKGAINRALNSYSEEFDFSVGVEAGLFSVKRTITGFIDFQVSAIYDGSRISVGFGPGFEYPPLVVEEVLKGKEVGDVMDEFTGIENLGEKTGAIHFLTKGKISRTDLTRLSVTTALIPWINGEYYFDMEKKF
ncbi:inosine/xanthosine triphosphatase [Archaeoglobales archaeon]|nr:MAG: inosine/xanthosine triphosphatase [Archaeoglobales archaeon]